MTIALGLFMWTALVWTHIAVLKRWQELTKIEKIMSVSSAVLWTLGFIGLASQ